MEDNILHSQTIRAQSGTIYHINFCKWSNISQTYFTATHYITVRASDFFAVCHIRDNKIDWTGLQIQMSSQTSKNHSIWTDCLFICAQADRLIEKVMYLQAFI